MIPLWAQIAGTAAAIASIISSSTQTTRMLKSRTAAGISPSTWILLTISSVAWFGYGVSVRSPQQIIANGSWVLLIVPLTWFMLHDRPRRTRILAEVGIALSLVIVIALGTVNENIPGWIGIPASLLVSAPQIRYSLRHGRGPGISVVAWAFLATSSYLWFTYGIGSRELPVIANSGIAALLGTIVVVALLVRPAPIEGSNVEAASDADFVSGGINDVEIPLSPRSV